jgi:hypothetical protein
MGGCRFGKLALLLAAAITFNGAAAGSAIGGGISIDAGLTPPKDRWIVRTQMRLMQRNDDPTQMQREMKSYMFPVVVAYGVRSDLAVMIRQVYMYREMMMSGTESSNSGFGDLFVLAKYKAFRINQPSYTLGVAPTIGLEMPTGNREFTSNSWDLQMGVFGSGRCGSLAMDINLTYSWLGMTRTDDSDNDPGDEYSFEYAVAYQVGVGEDANLAIAPVLESSYKVTASDKGAGQKIANTGESIFLLSPGVKITQSSFIAEGLIQFPVWQSQNGIQTRRDTGLIVGVRVMF